MDIFDRIAQWRDGDCKESVHEYLGWTEREYTHWENTGEEPKRLRSSDQ